MEWLCERQCILCVKSFIVWLHWQQRQKTTIDPHSAPPGWKWPLRGGDKADISDWSGVFPAWAWIGSVHVSVHEKFHLHLSHCDPSAVRQSLTFPTLCPHCWLRVDDVFEKTNILPFIDHIMWKNLCFLSYRNVFGFKCESIVCVKTLFIICWCDSVTCWLSFPFPCLLVKAKAAVSCFCPEHTRPNMRKLSLLQRQQKKWIYCFTPEKTIPVPLNWIPKKNPLRNKI